jgi:hypothetical protein
MGIFNYSFKVSMIFVQEVLASQYRMPEISIKILNGRVPVSTTKKNLWLRE